MGDLDSEMVKVVKKMASAISKHGVTRVVGALNNLNEDDDGFKSERLLISFIIDECSKKFQVNPSDLSKKNIRGVTSDARSMCFVLIKKYLNYSHQDIAKRFNSNNHSMVSSALKRFDDLNYNVKTDRIFLDIFKDLDSLVSNKKDMIWLKNS
jgi:chromosomal replication initiation ATPase DnaA